MTAVAFSFEQTSVSPPVRRYVEPKPLAEEKVSDLGVWVTLWIMSAFSVTAYAGAGYGAYRLIERLMA